MNPGTLVVRVDGNFNIGMGHLMRCLALAHAWQGLGGQIVFVMAADSAAAENRLKDEGVEVVRLSALTGSESDSQQLLKLATSRHASWVVLDGYQFSSSYQRCLKEAQLQLLVVDDYGHASEYWADLIVNQNLHATESLYRSRQPYTRLLLGTRYVLLRREFLRYLDWRREIAERAHKVLITLGGSDKHNVTLQIMRILKSIEISAIEGVIVVADTNPHHSELANEIQGANIPWKVHHGGKDMPELMAWADLAVSGGGTTAWELAFMRVPAALIIMADNQEPVVNSLAAHGACVSLGRDPFALDTSLQIMLRDLLGDKKRRQKLAMGGRMMVDGMGATRILEAMRGLYVNVRRVSKDDGELLWRWANDPHVRAMSFSQEPIPWDVHVQWFEKKLQDPSCHLFLFTNSLGAPVGQVRFDLDDKEAELHVSVDSMYRGQGYGSTIIRLAVEELMSVAPIRQVHAFVRPENQSSVRAFERASFRPMSNASRSGLEAIHLTLTKTENCD